MSSSRFLNPVTPGGLLTIIQGLLTADEMLVVQSISTNQYFHLNEIPTGTKDGVNKTFTLAYAPNPTSSLEVYFNGQKVQLTTDYTVSGTTLTLVTFAPQSTDILTVNYIVSPI